MEIRYTGHALWRLRVRKIESVWVEEALKYPDLTRRLGKKFYVQKKLNGRTIEVVFTKEKHINVKTVYWL